jgi:surface protein
MSMPWISKTPKQFRMYANINEQRYQFVLSLYLIRTQYPQMGLFQPDFIWVIFRAMMPSKYIRTDNDIHEAVDEWCEDHVSAAEKYGNVSKWNTLLVTNMKMKELFQNKKEFNDDISMWNVSNVTNMSYMLSHSQFNGDISGWNVSSVTNMGSMFCHTPFNGDISGWNMSSVTYMHGMFHNTPFNGDISGWNVSSVTDMSMMFCHTPFNGDISGWNIDNSCGIFKMVHECAITENHKPNGGNPANPLFVKLKK